MNFQSSVAWFNLLPKLPKLRAGHLQTSANVSGLLTLETQGVCGVLIYMTVKDISLFITIFTPFYPRINIYKRDHEITDVSDLSTGEVA